MEMKTLTVNGQTYTVADPDAAHIDDTVVSDKAWSGKNIADRLCPAFTESGASVTCQPVEGYPLQVVSRIEAVQEGSGDPSPDNVRPITGHAAVKLYRGGKNFFDISKVKTPSIEPLVVNNGDGSLTVTERDYGGVPGSSPNTLREYAPGLKIGQRYILHAKTTGSKAFIYLQEAGGSWYFGASLTMTEKILDSKVLWYAGANTTATIWDVQIEEGSAATEFEPYRGEEFTVELGQTVYGGSYDWHSGVLTVTHGYIDSYAGEEVPDGWTSSTGELSAGAQVMYLLDNPLTVQLTPQEVLALSGINTLHSDTGDTAVAGRADPRAVIEKLTNAIIALGGNV